jgi:hypothetical protein
MAKNADGSITVTINDLETAVPQLNARFAAMGIDETVVPVKGDCPTSSDPSVFQDPMFADPQETTSGKLTFTPGHQNLEPGYTGVIAAEQLASREVALAVEAIKPPVPSCFPTTVYTLQKTGTTTNGIPIYKATPVSPTTSTKSAS